MTRYRLSVIAEKPNPDYKPDPGWPDRRLAHEQLPYTAEELVVVLDEEQYRAVQRAVLETFK